MILKESKGCIYYQFESMLSRGVVHGVFTRIGGVSSSPWDSLNLGGTVGDAPEAVNQNLDRLLASLGFSRQQLVQVRQFHSADVLQADQPMDAVYHADGITTNQQGLLLLMRFADCVPLLYLDRNTGAVGIAHAGWQGTLKDVAGEAVRKMQACYGTNPEDLLVGIGPSIGPDHYEVGSDVIHQVRETYPDSLPEVLIEDSNGVKFDLWNANRLNLVKAGVRSIEISEICTGCNLDHWYSHRAERGRTGRFGAVIGLSEN